MAGGETTGTITASVLRQELDEARERTMGLISDLTDEQLIGPQLAIVNPLRWEIGHVAWFQEFWVLRHLRRCRPLLSEADALYNSAAVAHDTRWELRLPSVESTVRYMNETLERTLDLLSHGEPGGEEIYFHLLALFHEDMHTEAITYTRQTLSYPPPRMGRFAGGDHPRESAAAVPGDVDIPGGTFWLGATPELPFVFDNEKWAHPVTVRPFRIARTPVTQIEFAAFVDDGGYGRSDFWSRAGWQWREESGADHPVYWHRQSRGRWLQRAFDRWLPLDERIPMIHVNWYEAEAYCRWARRRLPTEAEWEMAASPQSAAAPERCSAHRKDFFPWGAEPPAPERANLDWRAMGCVEVGALPAGDSAFGCRQMIGNVWEWTASDFQPYPGFSIDPYREYSQPWFGSHKVLRGGCWATRSRLIRNTWRNFYTPDRRDVWAGFRTCALSDRPQ
jgi:iron(II)-dependent oxidoreductase